MVTIIIIIIIIISEQMLVNVSIWLIMWQQLNAHMLYRKYKMINQAFFSYNSAF